MVFSDPVDVANATWYQRDLPNPLHSTGSTDSIGPSFVGPYLELDVGHGDRGDGGGGGGGPARAVYVNGTGTTSLLFMYIVKNGDRATPLDVYVPKTDLTRTTALQRNGATVTRAPVSTRQSKANGGDWNNET